MQPTGFSINKESWMLLRDEPLYSARFIDREETDELVLVVRVEMLEWFVGMQPAAVFELTSWRSASGTWVVTLSYQLRANFGVTQGGAFYLNPYNGAEAEMLRKLLLREALPIVFLSEDCETHYTVTVPFDAQVTESWRKQIEEIHCASDGQQIADDSDAAFAAAVRELQLADTTLS